MPGTHQIKTERGIITVSDRPYLKPDAIADGYKYAHDYPGHFADLEFMPSELAGHKFYEPADNKHEEGLRTRLEGLWPKYYGK